jgi:hypothetical protein
MVTRFAEHAGAAGRTGMGLEGGIALRGGAPLSLRIKEKTNG